ncbi:cobaltochelatase subunit CobN [Ascidiaceihabitans sp.]|uniref:cobaltochelatase subunit CobN n=1 Tax=Ascidiaceihabitans sp. TaxID=1872644 RepID=UPI003296C293
MHVVFRESHGLEESETPMDLGQSPADLVVLSFSDSDLGAFAAGFARAKGKLPTTRLANLTALKHPLSVDTYVEQTLEGAKGILIRLIGGYAYWSYGLQQVETLCRAKGIALAVLPADGREDTRLDDVSTLPKSTLRRLSHLCDQGGEVAAQAALAQLALAAGLYAGPVRGSKVVPSVGAWTPEHGVTCPVACLSQGDKPRILISFYRAYLTSADMAPIKALFDSFRAKGCDVVAIFAPSLKAPDAAGWLRRQVVTLQPDAIVNATSFSGKGADGTSPLDAGNVPVFQIALGTSRQKAWAEAERGLSPTDLAMHVVLPEVDGRIFAGVASFKEPGKKDAALEYSRFTHRPVAARIAAITDQVMGWIALQKQEGKAPAIVLSTYPGKDWNMAHAVGLDALASTDAILDDLSAPAGPPLQEALKDTLAWPLAEYQTALDTLPDQLQRDLQDAWGNAADDPMCHDGALRFPATRRGAVLVALQPERGEMKTREDDYHDLARTPRHSYVAFYLWLRAQKIDALVHVGAHGTLEWLPGKSVALSDNCWPSVLIGDTPVIYPFIVNDPGEAAQAKRRIGAVTLGHIPPAMRQSQTPDQFVRLEALLDEFSNADGLDPKRRDRLQDDIRTEAQAIGVEQDLGLDTASCSAEAITRIDRFVCDIKESQFGDGLHIYGRVPEIETQFDSVAAAHGEKAALLDALCGKRIAPGPSGSPYRGRTDVLPTGRNLFTTDPRSVPTRSAYAQGVRLAEELVRRHLQEEGDYPKGLIVDLWGSATMRTAGEEFAMALALLGVKPFWDKGSERVSGIEVLPITDLDRPRLDVTLRVSGLFRDVFPTLSALYAQAVRVLGQRDEAPDWNPYVGQDTDRVFGPAPGSYGLGMGDLVDTYDEDSRRKAGEAWLKASSYALDGEKVTQNAQGIADRVAASDSFVHPQDLPETDLLLAGDYATHEAGFAAAKAARGGNLARLYHLDNTDPAHPRARTLPEEIARVVRARAANPDWIAGMQRHGFRGAAEIAATLEHMGAFAHLAQAVPAHLFDLYYDATLGDTAVDAFLSDANPEAHRAMQDRFNALHDAGLWQTRRNSIAARLKVAE